ncbi:hypothetical protein [Petrotoga sp. 8T1HF07.NaAc.6.1]|uniref:hypothetical protein n=1 Tax=Petrotoga sp. 8T1HF07.NaAc.6.1 TaxID=1351838 RepID=UPI00192BE032|nr:hypothetical protein [Petrotoga sp. 8T1HF07.NaAc.6.1]
MAAKMRVSLSFILYLSSKGGSQFLALQRLTRHRFHLVHTLASEKNWMLSNIYLKFSELAVNNRDKPFSDIYGATSCAALTKF